MNLGTLDLRCIVFMKVGFQVDETLEEIIRRKSKEEEDYGKIFWGYGGTLCHPLSQIKPFVRRAQALNLKPMLVMAFTPSRFVTSNSEWATEISEDGKVWEPIPSGVHIKGSRYAIVCKCLQEVDGEIDLASYEVAVGSRRGMRLSEYIRHRVDKGCAFQTCKPRLDRVKPVTISYVAEIVEPYAVFVRQHPRFCRFCMEVADEKTIWRICDRDADYFGWAGSWFSGGVCGWR